MGWNDLVVFEKPIKTQTFENHRIYDEDCKDIKELVERCCWYPKPEIPMPEEFIDVFAPKIIEVTYDEVSPFPKISKLKLVYRFLVEGEKVLQWSRLRLPANLDPSVKKKFGVADFLPYRAHRTPSGVEVRFINPKVPLKKVVVPYCRRICSTKFGLQCMAFGSYSQMELSPFLPFWVDKCSSESAKTCPMRLAKIKGRFPKPHNRDYYIKQFKRWRKTRNKTNERP